MTSLGSPISLSPFSLPFSGLALQIGQLLPLSMCLFYSPSSVPGLWQCQADGCFLHPARGGRGVPAPCAGGLPFAFNFCVVHFLTSCLKALEVLHQSPDRTTWPNLAGCVPASGRCTSNRGFCPYLWCDTCFKTGNASGSQIEWVQP